MSKVLIVTCEEIGDQIRARRRQARRRPEDLAKEIGVETSQVIRWEDGVYTPDLLEAQRLAAALECTVQDFMAATSGNEER